MQPEIDFVIDEGFVSGERRTTAAGLPQSQPGEDPMEAYSRAVIAAAEKVSPSVVYIEVQQPAKSRRVNVPRMPQEVRGSGSGFFFTPEGFFLPNTTWGLAA